MNFGRVLAAGPASGVVDQVTRAKGPVHGVQILPGPTRE